MKEPLKKSDKLTIAVLIAIFGFIFFIIIGVGISANDSKRADLAVKHCTVMEGADIYTSKDYSSGENVFEIGLKRCKNFRKNSYKNDGEFADDIENKWESRKSEELDGHNLEYYLNEIDWKD